MQVLADFISPAEAADKAKVSSNTVINWARTYGIGRRVGGRWRISPTELDRVLAGERVGSGHARYASGEAAVSAAFHFDGGETR